MGPQSSAWPSAASPAYRYCYIRIHHDLHVHWHGIHVDGLIKEFVQIGCLDLSLSFVCIDYADVLADVIALETIKVQKTDEQLCDCGGLIL